MAPETLNWWGEVTGNMQQMDDRSLVFDSPKMTETKYILGKPTVHLKTAADQPLLDWIIRLEDVAPDGSVSFITGGLFHSSQYVSRLDPKDFPIDKMGSTAGIVTTFALAFDAVGKIILEALISPTSNCIVVS